MIGGFGEARWLHIAITLFLVYAGLGPGFAGPRMRNDALISRQTYPIRIALPASRPAERPANAAQLALNEANSSRRRAYPIRIELPKAR